MKSTGVDIILKFEFILYYLYKIILFECRTIENY